MSCGDRYRDLVSTAGSGYTPDNPYGFFATPYDYAEWRELAHRLGVRTRSHLDRLQSADKTPEQTAESNALVERYNDLVTAVDALPGLFAASWSGVQLEQAIAQASGASQEAACIMELIDDQLAGIGLRPPAEPDGHKPKTAPLDLSGLTNFAIVGALGYGVFRLWKGGSR